MKILDGFLKINADDLIDGYYINKEGLIYRDYGDYIRYLNERESPYGYSRVSVLHKDGRRVDRFVHRLLMKTFVPNPDNKPEVNHIDGNKRNNKLENLEWVTGKENKKHSREILGNTKTDDKACSLYYKGLFLQDFDKIETALDYAVENYKCSRTSLAKYFTSNGCAIIKK